MILKLFKNKSKNIVLNKILENEKNINIESVLELNFDVKMPVIKLARNQYNLEYNYVMLDSKFYYVKNYKYINNDVVELQLEIDLLMSYKDYIKKLNCIVTRKKESDYILKDDKIVLSYVKKLEEKTYRGLDDRENQGCYLLVTSQYSFSNDNNNFNPPPNPDIQNPLE